MMKKRIRAATAALLISCMGQVSASGIPTVDLLNAAQMLVDAMEQAQQAAEQLSALEKEIEQAQEQFDEMKELTTGNANFGDMFNSDDLYDYIPTDPTTDSWEEIYSGVSESEVEEYRERYGLVSENETTQKSYDTRLKSLRALEAASQANNRRLENIKQLHELANTVETPQEKEDLQARLALEQAAIANEANRLATVQALMDKNEELENARQWQEFSDKISVEGGE